MRYEAQVGEGLEGSLQGKKMNTILKKLRLQKNINRQIELWVKYVVASSWGRESKATRSIVMSCKFPHEYFSWTREKFADGTINQ